MASLIRSLRFGRTSAKVIVGSAHGVSARAALVPAVAASRQRMGFHASACAQVAVGDVIPADAILRGASPGDEVKIGDLTKEGKYILVFVPGAFSPGCSARHVPGYLDLLPEFKAKGIKGVYFIAVNDPFVMSAWAKTFGDAVDAEAVKFLADPELSLVAPFDLDFTLAKVFGSARSKRAAVLINDGKVEKLFIEPDNTSVNVSEAKEVIKQI
ncbi:thioredoxin-like protein [Limtongia smithiae]|uniref:thioredoxin-like protein n=1 Tax=Limtongia smithiae TaxID=1125753 RepID=UPI0034CD676C